MRVDQPHPIGLIEAHMAELVAVNPNWKRELRLASRHMRRTSAAQEHTLFSTSHQELVEQLLEGLAAPSDYSHLDTIRQHPHWRHTMPTDWQSLSRIPIGEIADIPTSIPGLTIRLAEIVNNTNKRGHTWTVTTVFADAPEGVLGTIPPELLSQRATRRITATTGESIA